MMCLMPVLSDQEYLRLVSAHRQGQHLRRYMPSMGRRHDSHHPAALIAPAVHHHLTGFQRGLDQHHLKGVLTLYTFSLPIGAAAALVHRGGAGVESRL